MWGWRLWVSWPCLALDPFKEGWGSSTFLRHTLQGSVSTSHR